MFIRKVPTKLAVTALVSLLVCFAVWKAQQNHPTLLNIANEMSKLPSSDYGRLIDLVDFEFKINPPACSKLKNDPKIVIMVHSAPGNFNKRRVTREMWGAKDDRSLLLFVIGAVNDTELEMKILEESGIFEDIVQGSFIDAYRNMTYKHAAVFKWFLYNCPNAKFLLKTDDDVFVNTRLILDLLTTPSNQSQKLHNGNLILCEIGLYRHISPYRNKTKKWYVSVEEFAGDIFPEFCRGYTILYSADAVFKLYKASQTLPYLWIDDIHITGIVRNQAKVPLSTDARIILKPEDILNGNLKVESHQVMFGFPDLNEEKVRKLREMFNGS